MSYTVNISEKANLIWSIADKLTGAYKPHEYGEVILPLTVIRRFDCILEDTKDKVLEMNAKFGTSPLNDEFLKKASGYEFYNTSQYTFEKLLDAPDNIEANFRNYLIGFSENVRDIISKFGFDTHITRLANKGILYVVLQEFVTPKADMHPDKVSNLEMGYIFEEIIRKFSEAHNEDAGQHYTPREVIELMVNILFEEDNNSLSEENTVKTIYDPACGTGGMLTVAEEYIKRHNNAAKILCFGQELNDQTYAVCKADMLIKGSNADYIKNGSTLSQDHLKNEKFDYIISNPPFGREWKVDEKAVKDEAELGFGGRFGIGLPQTNDGQMLFLELALSKMKRPEDGGTRIAIIHNGAPLSIGEPESGPSEIRRYIIANDMLEAIIALPNDIFYNTGITTYLWIISNKKPVHRKGKVQLINANDKYEKRRKSLGNKRNEIPKEYVDEITKIYGDFKENEISKIFENNEFGYYKIIIEQPLLDQNGTIQYDRKGNPKPDSSLRDTELIPLKVDLNEYFNNEINPKSQNAWIESEKIKIGYEIPFNKYFNNFVESVNSNLIAEEIKQLSQLIQVEMKELFDNE